MLYMFYSLYTYFKYMEGKGCGAIETTSEYGTDVSSTRELSVGIIQV